MKQSYLFSTVDQCQRWRDRQGSYRVPSKEQRFDPTLFEVELLHDDTRPRAFVEQHHYSGSYPSARYRFGLRGAAGELVGVAVFSHPTQNSVLTNWLGGEAIESVELGRFVLLDHIKANAETWFLARCFKKLRHEGLRGVLAFSDPLPRRDQSGQLTLPGHIGTIYQAFNGVYLGRATARTLRMLPNGRVMNDRTIQKIRSEERGFVYAAKQLEGSGAPPLATALSGRAWLAENLHRYTTAVRHRGNHRYGWTLNGPQLESLGQFPKQIDAA